MGTYLNLNNSNFNDELNSKIYVDKSQMISKLNDLLPRMGRFLCVTRPRGFGKTTTLSMINAYYSKGCDSKELFDKLNISKDPSYLEHLNKHNVFLIDMSQIYKEATLEKKNYVDVLKKAILRDLANAFPDVDISSDTVGTAFMRITDEKNERFIFLMDEWDIPFREEPNTEANHEYVMLLRSLFKSSNVSESFDLVYITGIMPIIKDVTQSGLNNFDESTMLNPFPFEYAIGYAKNEVKELCDKYDVDFNKMKEWYDGYDLDGVRIYNPVSVNTALIDKKFDQCWTLAHSIEYLANYLNYGDGALKSEAATLLSGDNVPVCVRLFENDLGKIDSKDEALTALIHLGYLTYDSDSKTCRIPNYEIRLSFVEAVKHLKWNEI